MWDILVLQLRITNKPQKQIIVPDDDIKIEEHED